MRAVIELLADTGSMLELRTGYGNGMVTAFVRIEGRPVGIIANNNEHLGGSIESFGSDKAARFAKLCDSWNIPICTLVDTPGMMIGPEAEKTALVRRTSNLIVTLGNVKTPRFSVVLRKCYGLGSNTILFGNERAPSFTVAWPTAEFGGMNLEAAVRLGARDQLAAIDDLEERAALYEKLVAEAYERGGPLRAAETFRVDSVIDPMETRHWITQGLLAALPGNGDRDVRLNPIPGTVPSAMDWQERCRFRDRCSFAWERCAEFTPDLLPVGAGSSRSARCWLVDPDDSSSGPAGEPT